MGLLDFLFDDTLQYFQHLLGSARDSFGWAIQLLELCASRFYRSLLQALQHSAVPTLSAALGREVGMLRIWGVEVLISAVHLLAAAALVCLVLRALPRKAMWGASVVLCIALLQVQASDFTRAAQQQPVTPVVPATPYMICTPPLVNDTGRCDCPVGLVLDGSLNCVCPPRNTFDGSHCHECAWPREVRSNQCVCPHPMRWTGHACRCPGQLVEGGGGCVCPSMLVQYGADQCIPRMHAGTVDWIRVRADWSVDSMLLCTPASREGGCVGAGGGGGEEREWRLKPNQCIVRVDWWRGDSVVGVRFTANDGATFFHGNTDAKPDHDKARDGECLVGAELGDHRPFKYFGTRRVLKHFRPQWG